MKAPTILVAGEINADLVLREVSPFPALGREVLVSESDLVLGSASAICASGIARLGNRVVFAGKVGDDLFGRFCREEMSRSGIGLDHVIVDKGTTTGITVSLSSGRDRALVTCLGAIAEFAAEDVPDAAFEGASHLHVAGYFLQTRLRAGLPDLFRRARLRGLTTSLDSGHDPAGEWRGGLDEALKEADLFFPNQEEIRAVSRREDLEDALRSFGTMQVVAKLGPSGAAALDGGAMVKVPAPKVDVVDTTGAGDSFDAGFLHAWLRGRALKECLRYGVAAGSLSTRTLGGTNAQPTLQELEAFLERSGSGARRKVGLLDGARIIYNPPPAEEVPNMTLSRRSFLKGAGALGSILPARLEARPLATQTDVFSTPATVERRNGIPYRAFGKTGDSVSILGVGGFHIGVPEESEGLRIVRTAIDEGVNFMDNAWEYHEGESERRMGKALRDGYREKAFVMTKGCARDAKGAMAQLEESLTRLGTDVIDLWQFHECNYDNDPDLLFAKDGAIHVAVKAKEQGKIRFIGFTGHKSPHIHLKMLAQGFDWDAVQMPVNLCDAHYRSFTREVLPVAIERGIAVIAMKTQGGGMIPEKAGVSAHECLRYSMSLSVPVCLSGMRNLDEARQNVAFAKTFEPLSTDARNALLAKVEPLAGAGVLERFKSTQRYDSTYHQQQHGFQ